MNINDRVKAIRNKLDLTQIEFGRKTGISQGHLTSIENGKRTVTEKTLKVICATFDVDEKWLRNGEGEMFCRPEAFSLDEYAKRCNLTPLERDILRGYMELDDSTRRDIMRHFRRIVTAHADEIEVENDMQNIEPSKSIEVPSSLQTSDKNIEKSDNGKLDPDIKKKLDSYRKELEEEKSSQTSAVSQNTDKSII